MTRPDKTFLGETGNFNGDDIIDIVVKQPACHKFIARHLYNFFVADEPQVPAWDIEEPRNPAAIEEMMTSFRESGYDMKAMLRTIFTSDWFKERPLRKDQEPGRDGREHPADRGWRRNAAAELR